ncbi:MAG: CHAT domain-containing protein, partial [Blastocatellia bacterium]
MKKKIRILFLASSPSELGRLRVDREAKQIKEMLERARFGELFEFIAEQAVAIGDLQRVLLRYQPDVVHFSGHGSETQGIILEDAAGNAQPVKGEALAAMFRIIKDNVRVVVLNSCYGANQARAIAEVIDYTIGMTQAVGDEAAIIFSAFFYQGLAFGRSIQEAFELGKIEIALEGVAGQEVPVLIV